MYEFCAETLAFRLIWRVDIPRTVKYGKSQFIVVYSWTVPLILEHVHLFIFMFMFTFMFKFMSCSFLPEHENRHVWTRTWTWIWTGYGDGYGHRHRKYRRGHGHSKTALLKQTSDICEMFNLISDQKSHMVDEGMPTHQHSYYESQKGLA
jgi:hypothetical protein